MIKITSLIIPLAGLQASRAFDYNITATGGLSLFDVKSGIDEVLTLFTNEVVTVSVIDIEWGPRTFPANSSNNASYMTYIDGKLAVVGSVDLSDVGRELPTSVSAGDIKVSSGGSHTIKVVLAIDSDEIETEFTYQAFKPGASLVPLIVVLVLALTTRQVEISLGLAIAVGACMVTGSIIDGFKSTLDTYVLGALSDINHGYVYLFSLFLSGMVAMLERSGGLNGFTKDISKFAHSPWTGQMAAYLSGCFIFFDDYASSLLVGQSMAPLVDILHTSREKLAFIVDATSAPVASLTPISSWVGFEVGLIQTEIDRIIKLEGTDQLSIQSSGLAVFLQSIRYRYYPIFMMILIPTLIALKRDFGPMLIAERKTQVYKRMDGGDGHGRAAGVGIDSNSPEKDTPLKSWNMFIPVFLLIFLIIWMLTTTGDDGSGDQSFIEKLQSADSYSSLLWGTMGAALCSYAFYMIQFKKDGEIVFPTPMVVWIYLNKVFRCRSHSELNDEPAVPLMTMYEAMEAFLFGMGRIFPALIVLTLAWASGAIMTAVGTDRLFSSWIVDSGLPPEFLPTMSFVISLFMAMATGTSWGTMSIVFPLLLVPTWVASKGDALIFYATVAGVLSGSVAGDHASPISDTTVLSALSTNCDLLKHVVTQTPYSVFCVIISVLIGTLPVGYDVWPNFVCILFGVALIILFALLVCKPIIAKNGKFDIFVELYIYSKGESCELNILRNDTIAAWEYENNNGPAVLSKASAGNYDAGKVLSHDDDMEVSATLIGKSPEEGPDDFQFGDNDGGMSSFEKVYNEVESVK